ncbi:MAG TPA: FtsX-like permease family protein, partial [Pirellulales bacterium]|nr:FtsX-like permease family protein [Pirellulales bacterium]
MRLITVAAKNVLRRKSRSALAAAGVATAAAAAIALVGFSTGFETSAKDIYLGHGVDLVVVHAGLAQRLTSSLNESVANQIAALPHVAAVSGCLTDVVSFGEGSLVGIPVHGWPPESFLFDTLTISSGQRLAVGDRQAILLGARLAESINKRPGDQVEIESYGKFHVAGIFRGVNVLEDASAVVWLSDLQQLMDRPGQVTEFQIKLDREIAGETAALEQVRRQIESLKNPAGERWGLSATPSQQYASGSTEVHMAHGLAWATTAIAMVIGCVGVLNTMSMSVFERTQEIGVLRAIGWHRWRIVLLLVCESELIAATGALLGAAVMIPLGPLLARIPWVQGLIRPEVAPTVVALA